MADPEEVPRPLDGAELCAGDLLGEDAAVLGWDQDVGVADYDQRRGADLGYPVADGDGICD